MSLSTLLNDVDVDLSWTVASTSLRLTRTLAHFAWQGCVVATMFAFFNHLLRQGSANIRYIAGLIALSVLAVCPVATFSLLSTSSIERRMASNQEAEHEVREFTISQPTSDATRPKSIPNIGTFDGSVETAAQFLGAQKTWIKQISLYVAVGYAIGVLAMLLRLTIGLRAGRSLQQTSTVVRNETVQFLLRDISARWAMRVVPTVAYCQQVTVPVVVGVLRPMILLPPSLMTGLTVTATGNHPDSRNGSCSPLGFGHQSGSTNR